MADPSAQGRERQRGFRPLPRGDRLYLVVVIGFALLAFLPWSRDIHVGPMALLGWLMAALMVLSPAIALVRLRSQRRLPTEDDGGTP